MVILREYSAWAGSRFQSPIGKRASTWKIIRGVVSTTQASFVQDKPDIFMLTAEFGITVCHETSNNFRQALLNNLFSHSKRQKRSVLRFSFGIAIALQN